MREGPPQPEKLAAAAGPERLVPDPVKIEPEKAVGYQSLPTSVTGIYDRKPRDLSLADVVVQDLSNNRNIKIQGYSVRIAEYQVPVNKGIYDLLMSGDFAYTRNEQQGGTQPPFTVGRSRNRSGNFALSQLIPTGGTLSAVYNLSQQFPHSYSNSTSLQVNQPLLQGLGWTVTNANIRIALLESQGSLADFQTDLEDQLQNALNRYWELIGVIEALKVQIISYAAAKDLLRINQAKFDVGLLPIADLLQTMAALDARYDSIIQARSAVRNLEDQLKQLIFMDHEAPQWGVEIRPTQAISWRELTIDQHWVLNQALAQRPELKRAESDLAQARERQKVTRNNILPVLNFFAMLLPNGVGNDYDQAFHNMDSGKATSYNAGLQFSFPLQNRAARYRNRQAQAQIQQSEEQLKNVTDQVTQEVRSAVRNYESARERIQLSQSQIESEQANLETEQLRLQVGLSTTFFVLQFQQDLANAQLAHIRAVIDTNEAAIALDRARGTLLQTYGVQAIDDQPVKTGPKG